MKRIIKYLTSVDWPTFLMRGFLGCLVVSAITGNAAFMVMGAALGAVAIILL